MQNGVAATETQAAKQKLAKTLQEDGRDLFVALRPRETTPSYRGVQFFVMVASFTEICCVKVWCRLKELGVMLKKVQILFCEDHLCPMQTTDWQGSVPEELFADVCQARKALRNFMEDASKSTAAETNATLLEQGRV